MVKMLVRFDPDGPDYSYIWTLRQPLDFLVCTHVDREGASVQRSFTPEQVVSVSADNAEKELLLEQCPKFPPMFRCDCGKVTWDYSCSLDVVLWLKDYAEYLGQTRQELTHTDSEGRAWRSSTWLKSIIMDDYTWRVSIYGGNGLLTSFDLTINSPTFPSKELILSKAIEILVTGLCGFMSSETSETH